MNDLVVVNPSRRLPRPVRHQIVRRNLIAPTVLQRFGQLVTQMGRGANSIVHQPVRPYAGDYTNSRWVTSTPVENSRPPMALAPLVQSMPLPVPAQPLTVNIKRSSLLDFFD